MKKTKNIIVTPYNPAWPEQFQLESSLLKKTLSDLCVDIHHVGSTSVPGLAAKPKIDIIAVIKDNPLLAIQRLEASGFTYKGEFNIPMHYGFNKRGLIDINLHVYVEGHPEIELNLAFRDYLRTHSDIRDAYANLKNKLLENESSFEKTNSIFTGYNLGKDAFIRKVLEATQFTKLRFLKCTHFEEWRVAKKLRLEFFKRTDPEEWTFTDPHHLHFVFCLGVTVIGYAHVELLENNQAHLKLLLIEEDHKTQTIKKEFLQRIEEYLTQKNITFIYS
jgi:GrpB-like predicted nucleotidyltransferase (UPF0157 family)